MAYLVVRNPVGQRSTLIMKCCGSRHSLSSSKESCRSTVHSYHAVLRF